LKLLEVRPHIIMLICLRKVMLGVNLVALTELRSILQARQCSYYLFCLKWRPGS